MHGPERQPLTIAELRHAVRAEVERLAGRPFHRAELFFGPFHLAAPSARSRCEWVPGRVRGPRAALDVLDEAVRIVSREHPEVRPM